MNVKTLCLAILSSGEATGYEIKKLSVEGKYSYFVDASFGSIYPALSRLEAEGMVTAREEVQSGKPARKIYVITAAGRQALLKALSELPGRDVFRSEFLLVAMAADLLPPEVIKAAIEERERLLTEELAHLQQVAEEAEHAGAAWAARYGVRCLTNSLEHLRAHRGELEAIAGTGRRDALAADDGSREQPAAAQ